LCLIVCETKDKGSLTYWLIYILVAQQAEALDLKSIQYEFESHRGYKKIKKDFTKCLADWKSLHIFVKQIGLEVNYLIIQ
jgi:hypothetical protein